MSSVEEELVAYIEKLGLTNEMGSITPVATGICASCRKTPTAGEKLKTCSACKVAQYCSIDCQRKDFKESHKRHCSALKGLSTLSPGPAEHPLRTWKQDIGASSHQWPDGASFDGASQSLRNSLVRSPELRGPLSHVQALIMSGVLAAGADSMVHQALAGTSRPYQPAKGDKRVVLAANLSDFLAPLIVGLTARCEAKARSRLESRGCPAPPPGREAGCVVVECVDAPVEQVMGGSAFAGGKTVLLALCYLDRATLSHYVRARFEATGSQRNASELTADVAKLLQTLDGDAGHAGSLAFVMSYRHQVHL